MSWSNHLNKKIIKSLQIFEKIIPNTEQLKIISQTCKILEKKQKQSYIDKILKRNKNGVYFHGKVGRGKSIILSAFERELSYNTKHKHHFNELIFALQRIHFSENKRSKDTLVEEDIICKFQKFIYIDEIYIDNIADLQLILNFMTAMVEKKIFMLFTSNHHPKNIYKKNYNSKRVSDFRNYIEKTFDVFEFKNKRDYRKDLKVFDNFYFDNDKKTNFKQQNFLRKKIVGSAKKEKKKFIRTGNDFFLDGVYKDLLEIEFNEICGKNFGHKDYEIIVDKINFIFIRNLPTLKQSINDKIKRFIILIDMIYEKKKILSISLMNPLNEIFPKDKNNIDFARTFSRLNEMRSEKYIFKNINKTINLK